MIYLIGKQIILTGVLALLCMLTSAQDGSIPPLVINGVSIPGDFPQFSPGVSNETAPGNIFITNRVGTPYLLIYANDGSPVYYQLLKDRSLDFKVHSNGMLSRWIEEDVRGHVLMDSHFENVDTLSCQNGFETNDHEFQLLANGHSLMIANEERNLTQIDPEGDPKTTVIGNHIQELDENGNVVFQWLCWDHFKLEDSYKISVGVFTVDYVHMNSIAVDYDGHLVISSRHLSECTKINRETGEIIWRLGGKNNQFNFINDIEQFSYQHDIRPVPGQPDHYTIFDNGTTKDPPYSRAVEYRLDTLNRTAEKVWEYRSDPDRYALWMGNVQRLPNGNTLINWGSSALPKITEVTPEGVVVYEADFTTEMSNYRTFRFEFDAYMLAPYLIAEPYPDRVRLLFNKFGDPGVQYFNIYGGEDPEQMDWIDSTSAAWIDLMGLGDSKHYYLEVTAVDSFGVESSASNREKVFVRNSIAGENLILNGDFTDEDSYWIHQNQRDGLSSGSISDSIYRFNIENAGLESSDVKLYQQDIPLIHGKEYILELDAKADSPRTVNIEMERAGIPWTNYSKNGLNYITGEFTHIEHTFTMGMPNDLQARIAINGGGSDIDFEVKNISLRQVVLAGTGPISGPGHGLKCYPNPASDNMHIQLQLETTTSVNLELLNLMGQLIQSVHQGNHNPGQLEILLDTKMLENGAYLLRLRTGAHSHSTIILVQH